MTLERAYLLYEQSRYAQAEQEVRRSPPHPLTAEAQALLALCLVKQSQFAAALAAAETAVQLGPACFFAYYALAVVQYERNQYAQAERAIALALQLNPEHGAAYALWAAIALDQQQWTTALRATELGLHLHPENASCLNLRAAALLRLNHPQAAAAVETALQQHPEDASSHANRGWLLLEQRQYPQALQAFQQALRLNPRLEWGRQGLLCALKARYPLYGALLRYSLAIAKLAPGLRWSIILGGWLAMQGLRRLARAYPDLAVWLTPVLVAYVLLVYFTWIADPLFNLLLGLDRYGRLILSRDERRAAIGVGGLLGGAIATLRLALRLGSTPLLAATAVLGLLVIPVSALFSCTGAARRTLTMGAIALSLLGGLGVALALVQGQWGAIALIPLSLFLLGILTCSFLSNVLIQQAPEK